MQASAPQSAAPRPSMDTEGTGDVCAAFVIDADGNVLASNATARELWRAEKRSLVATPFSHLFAPGAVAQAAGELADSWTVLKADAGKRWKPYLARAHDGVEIATRVRIERAFGGGGSYIAVVQPVDR